MGAVVSRVEPGSVAARYGFLEGDEIVTINNMLLRDIIDYYFLTSEHKLVINYIRNGLPHSTVIHKSSEESLGLDFKSEIFDDIKKCRYNCIFCFVSQQPPKLRPTLYIKDDDYRLSFLHGNYITLTDMAEIDLRRITAMRLSPLYVSVHATDPDVRAKMMGGPSAANIMKMLQKLKNHDIQCHTQIVVVPGYNDGKVLKQTLQDLYGLFPTVKTIAVVPVGVTKYLDKAHKVRTFKTSEAQEVYDIVTEFQERVQQRIKYPFAYLSDEFYLMLDKEFPKYSHYGYFEQMGNGVGLCRRFLNDYSRKKRYLPENLKAKKNVWVVTGLLGEKVLKPHIKDLNKIKNLKVRLIPVKNNFFGTCVTVTGLLAGQDVRKKLEDELSKREKPDYIIIPDIILRDDLFLDDLSLSDLSNSLGVKIDVVDTSATGLLDGIFNPKSKIKIAKPENIPDEIGLQEKKSRDMQAEYQKASVISRSANVDDDWFFEERETEKTQPREQDIELMKDYARKKDEERPKRRPRRNKNYFGNKNKGKQDFKKGTDRQKKENGNTANTDPSTTPASGRQNDEKKVAVNEGTEQTKPRKPGYHQNRNHYRARNERNNTQKPNEQSPDNQEKTEVVQTSQNAGESQKPLPVQPENNGEKPKKWVRRRPRRRPNKNPVSTSDQN